MSDGNIEEISPFLNLVLILLSFLCLCTAESNIWLFWQPSDEVCSDTWNACHHLQLATSDGCVSPYASWSISGKAIQTAQRFQSQVTYYSDNNCTEQLGYDSFDGNNCTDSIVDDISGCSPRSASFSVVLTSTDSARKPLQEKVNVKIN